MALQSPIAGLKTITGYILPEEQAVQPNKDDGLESEDEEEEGQPEFLDMKEMNSVSSGGNMFKSLVPTSKEVSILVGKKTYKVEGRFPLCDPWWEVTCTIRLGRLKAFVKGYPFYRLRTHLKSEGRSLLSLFLTACKAQADHVKMFMDWLPTDRRVELVNVLDVLQEFEDSSLEHEAVAQQLKSSVNCSVVWTHVKAASLYPGIMKYLPTLLPGQYLDIIKRARIEDIPETSAMDEDPQNEQRKTNVLSKLEELINTNNVWKLGFNYIMFKELHLIRCEAKLEAFKLCDLFSAIPLLQRNALILYAELKKHCRVTGSTYITQEMLVDKIFSETGADGAWAALHFLVTQGVLMKESTKVALRNLLKYEKGIAECLTGLVQGDPWKIHLDVKEVLREAQIKRLRAKACEKHNATMKSKDDANTSASAAENSTAVFEQLGIDLDQPGTSSMVHNGETPSCDDSENTTLTIKEENLTSDSDSDLDIDPSTIELDCDQVRAAEMMCANPVTVISGKGGCGKTTVVSLVFKAAMEQQTSDLEEVQKACEDFQNDSHGSSNGLALDVHEEKNHSEKSISNEKSVEVLLTAPTGRAASLLTKRTGFTAYTMHQVLWSFMTVDKDRSGNPQDWKFSKVRVLVVDEGSLVSVQILHSILSMLTKHAQLQKFIILGDVRQLPSIEPGNTLYDLFEGLRRVRWAIEMRTNHRAESELIVRNAGLISEMGKKKYYKPLDFDATIDMTNPSAVPSDKRFIFIKISSDNFSFDLQEAILFLLKEAPGLKDHILSQFVAFRRKDCELINELCCRHYSNHTTKTAKKTFNFQVGDKVCCTKNGYVTDYDKKETSLADIRASHNRAESQQDDQKKEKKEKKERLCNGEIFFIKDDVTKSVENEKNKMVRQLTLDDKSDRQVTCNYKELQRECKLRHSWARTIHTFQGSEAETIVYILGDSPAQNWQHVYTAVTRGQKRVYVVGTEYDLEGAIRKRITPRNTRLCGFVNTKVGQQDPLTTSASTQRQAETTLNHSFGHSQSTPVASQTPIRPQMLSSTRPSCARNLYTDKNGEGDQTSNISLQDDMAFSQAYSWSPMDSCDEAGRVQNENMTELSNHVDDALLATLSSSPNESSRGSKRTIAEDIYSTPSKLPKQTASEESPMVSSRLNLLSLSSPDIKSSRQLFQDDTHSHRGQP
ncbi:DNA helicase B isoform X1 [Danio rerio]|uniref:DNA helicase B n=2 Tax=Danio rerio TaxID=7955 RepID=B0UYS3_DANRE|nr:DNA helicase B [Danio rerio]|eukprot:XP_001336777.3 DNA helicase B [Danio rerio]